MTWPGYDVWKARQYERDAERARRLLAESQEDESGSSGGPDV